MTVFLKQVERSIYRKEVVYVTNIVEDRDSRRYTNHHISLLPMLVYILSNRIIIIVMTMVGKTCHPADEETKVTHRQQRQNEYTGTHQRRGKSQHQAHQEERWLVGARPGAASKMSPGNQNTCKPPNAAHAHQQYLGSD